MTLHDTEFRIAMIPRGQRGRAVSHTVTWSWLCSRLGKPSVDQVHTIEEYQKFSEEERASLKDVGSFVGGPFLEGKRKKENLIKRTILTLDLDDLGTVRCPVQPTRSPSSPSHRCSVVLPRGTLRVSEHLCNSFDLVRIHKFGHLDIDSDGDVTRHPSYRAMLDFARKDETVTRELAESNIDTSAILDDLDVEAMQMLREGRFSCSTPIEV